MTSYAQTRKPKMMRWEPAEETSVASGGRNVKYILHNPSLSKISLSEYFNLEVVDIPENLESVLRRYPCWVVARVADTSVYDGEHYVEKDVYGSEDYPFHNVFVFKHRGYWQYSVASAMLGPAVATDPNVVAEFRKYNDPHDVFPLQVIMCGKGNKYVIGVEKVMYENGKPQPSGSFLTYLIQPASREKLKQMKSLVKKAAVVAQYNKEIKEFLD